MKTTIFVTCTILSFIGILGPLLLTSAFFIEGDPLELLYPSLCTYAWYCYFVMGIAWLKNQKVEKWYPYSGTLAGIFASLTPSIAASYGYGSFPDTAMDFFGIAFFVLPAVIMAVWLVFFHLKGEGTHAC